MSISDKVSTALLRTLAGAIFRSRATESLAQLGLTIGGWARDAKTAADVRRIRAAVDPVHVAAMRHAITFDALSRSLEAAIDQRPLAVLREAHAIGELTDAEFTAYAGAQPAAVARLDAAEKIAALDALLARSAYVRIRLDARHPDVVVPSQHREPGLVLAIGRRLTPPISLDLGVDALSCVLSFGGAQHRVEVPWPRLYAAADEHQQITWSASAPFDLAAVEVPQPEPEAPAAKHGKLRLVD